MACLGHRKLEAVGPTRAERGAHPDATGLAYLRKHGVRTIINLEATGLFESSSKDIDAERAEAEKLGITFVYKPTSSYLPVNGKQMDAVLAILDGRLPGDARSPLPQDPHRAEPLLRRAHGVRGLSALAHLLLMGGP